jgi:LCP family protein required for cell wall assembly
MPSDPPHQAPPEDPPYRTYRAGQASRPNSGERPYRLYRSHPRGLLSRLRGEDDTGLPKEPKKRRGDLDDEPGGPRRRITPRRVFKWLAIAIVAWLVLSLVLFLVSAQIQSGSLPQSTEKALTSGSNMITGTDTILVLGTDERPKGSKEPGADTSDAGSRSDTIMLWRIGGGTSRRLSIPRDTVANIPGFGPNKINAAYAFGGPTLAVKTVEQFTGVKINHVIVVNLANFPKFIDAIGGIDIRTPRICSQISGGAKNGGFSLYLKPGEHHLSGIQALTLARTRENSCDPADNDLTREARQQQILNSIKSKLTSPGIFFRLPWASWYAPQTVRTDMGGFTLLSLFAAAEFGGSTPPDVLHPSGTEVLPGGGDALVATPGQVHRSVNKLLNG